MEISNKNYTIEIIIKDEDSLKISKGSVSSKLINEAKELHNVNILEYLMGVLLEKLYKNA